MPHLQERMFRGALRIALSVASISIAPLQAEDSSRSGASLPFIVYSHLFSSDGTYIGSGRGTHREITSLVYGERLQETLFYPAVSLTPAANSNPEPGAPARPPHSRFTTDRWTTENGLPANKVRSLLQSKDGYLWIGTVGGLARFDSLGFTLFTETNTPALAENGSIVRAMIEDRQGRLWLGTKRGLLCRDGNRFVPFPSQERFRGTMINGLAQRWESGVWVVHDDGVSWVDPDGEQALPLPGLERPFCVWEQNARTLWIGAMNGLFRCDLPAIHVTRVELPGEPASGGSAVYGLMADRLDRLWIGSDATYRLDGAGQSASLMTVATKAGLPVPRDARFAEDPAGRVWATTQAMGGLVMYPEDESAREWIQTLAIGDALCILSDRDGAIWVGTHEGLVRLRERPFSSMRLEGPDTFGGPVQAVTQSPSGRLYFVARDHVGWWSDRKLAVADLSTLVSGEKPMPGAIAVFAGKTWAPHPQGGLFAIPDLEETQLARAVIRPVHPNIGRLRALHSGERSGALWIASEAGLFRMNTRLQLNRVNVAPELDVTVLLEDRNGGLWIGGPGGLNYLRNGSTEASAPAQQAAPLKVLSLHESTDGSLWIGAESGLLLWRDNSLVALDSGAGMARRPVLGIVEDESGRLWLNHESDITRVSAAELTAWTAGASDVPVIQRFTLADGLSALDRAAASPQGCLRTRDGRLWFAKGNGLAVIDPAHFPSGPPPVPPVIEEISVNGAAHPPGEPLRITTGRAPAVVFGFAAPNLHSPGSSVVQYRLDGLDPGWRNAVLSRSVTYLDLSPGEYLFRLRVRNHRGQWSERETSAPLSVSVPVWQRRAFKIVVGLLVAVSGTGLAGWLGCRARRVHQLAVARERERVARDLHDHIAPRLSQIALAAQIEDAACEAERSSRELREIIWELHPANDSLASLFDFLSDWSVRHLSAAGISVELDFPPTPFLVPVPAQTRREISALFKETLQNVVRHAHAAAAMIKVRWGGEHLELTVSDNGRGFDLNEVAKQVAAGPRASHGLRNFQARCRELGGRCEIRTAPGQGTTVTFILPIAN